MGMINTGSKLEIIVTIQNSIRKTAVSQHISNKNEKKG